ncbi:MAG: MEDS domain-containing protein [Gemmatimonadota bacterium]
MTASVIDRALAPSDSCHMVQLFDNDTSLSEVVSQYLGAGLAAGEMVILIATAAHRSAIRRQLTDRAFDLERAQAAGLYTELDAHDLLAGFLVDGRPDATKFEALVGDRIEAMQQTRPGVRIRAYGEMVDLLWGDDNPAAALELESLWNDFCARQPLALLCAYHAAHFGGDAGETGLEAVCGAHDYVVPREQAGALPDANGRLRELTLLQQRAAALSLEVTRRTALEGDLREALSAATAAHAVADESVRYNELFTRMVGHDLRNPLNAIVTTAHYLTRISTEPKLLRAAQRITSSSMRMARMIEQLLDFTRIQVGKGLHVERGTTDLLQLCQGLVTTLQSTHPGRTIVLASRGVAVGELDAERMTQVLSTLLLNAVHYGDDARPVRLDLDGSDPGSLTVSVHNGGVVSPEVMPLFFAPMHGGLKGEHTQALGLGLYLTRALIRAHGGEIAVHSSAAGGTVVRVELPRQATVEMTA